MIQPQSVSFQKAGDAKLNMTNSGYITTCDSILLNKSQNKNFRFNSDPLSDTKQSINKNDSIQKSPKSLKHLENLKFYPKVSEKAVYLRSKLLLRDELKRSIKFIEKDLKINNEKALMKIEKFKALGVDRIEVESVNEQDLKDLNYQIFYLEKELSESIKERDFLINIYVISEQIDKLEDIRFNSRKERIVLAQ